jgi:type I restriction enzyme M protein
VGNPAGDKSTSLSAVAREHSAFIWSIAELLRGDYKPNEYRLVILPLTILRRLDCVLEPTKDRVLAEHQRLKGKLKDPSAVLFGITGMPFYNVSKLTFQKLTADPTNVGDHLLDYINGFSPDARDVLDKFDFANHVRRLERSKLLYLVVGRFAELDLHPDKVSNLQMGYLYEELIRRFSELSNEQAGDHFTPREVIRLMVNLLFIEDKELLTKPGIVTSLYDPACGTGGMLSESETYLRELNTKAKLKVFGQELNAETFAICRSDMMLKDQDASNIHYGNSFTEDGEPDRKFDYMLANPPFGVDWKKVQDFIDREHEKDGFAGRFGAGLPRINDGSFLFLQHMISKMKPAAEGGSRLAIVFNGSPLFTGGAGSGESEIRRWIIENDWLEGVVALPDQLFYNTGISTYFWIVTNRKSLERRGKVQLVDARQMFVKMGNSLGNKRNEISAAQIAEITRLYEAFEEGEKVKIFPNHTFGFMRITVERPLRLASTNGRPHAVSPAELKDLLASSERDPQAEPISDKKGHPIPDPDLRDYENVAVPAMPVSYEEDVTNRLASVECRTAIDDYMAAEVLPYLADAWVDHLKTRVAYEIPLTRHFYRYSPPRPLDEIDAEIKALEAEIQDLLGAVTK